MEVIRKPLFESQNLMKVIVTQLASTTSPQLKHYTVALTADGTFLTHYGAREKTINAQTRMWKISIGRGKTSPAVAGPLGANSDRFRKQFGAKFKNSEYDTIVIDFQTFDLSASEEEALKTPYSVFKEVYSLVDVNQTKTKPNYIKNTDIDNVTEFTRAVKSGNFNNLKVTTATKPAVKVATAKIPKAKVAPEPTPTFFTEVETTVVRPNGEKYFPRELMGHTDISLLREFKKAGIYVRLAGPPGSGKTALAEAAYPDLITVSGHGDMTVAHFVGSHLPTQNGGWDWVDGPLVKAMREGKTLFVDEGTRIPTEVLNILFSVMDGRNILRIDDRPDLPIIQGAKGFYVVMGYNPDTLGARPLDEALVSRFRVQIDVDTDFDTARKLGVPPLVIKIARNLHTRNIEDKKNEGIGIWVPQMRELITYRDLVKVGAGEDFALATLLSSCPRTLDVPFVQAAIKDVAKKTINVPALGRIV